MYNPLKNVAESEEFVNNIDLLYRLNQDRLETLRQEAQLNALLKSQKTSWKYRTAKTLHQLALRLYPEVESPRVLHYSKAKS